MVFGFGKSSGLDSGRSLNRNEKGTAQEDIVESTTPTELEANQELNAIRKENKWDPNLPSDVRDELDIAVATHDKERELELVHLFEDNSPYPEVRAAVRNYDEDVPANTFRAWFLGMVMCTVGSGLNMLFSMRSPSITITSLVAQLVAWPLGIGMEKITPTRTFNTFGYRWTLNPGPFNMKEHALITIMANVSFGTGVAYSTDTILALKGFYGRDLGWGFNLLVTFGTQMIGFGIAGLLRRYLVWPAAMIWPSNLVNTSLFYALHDHSPSNPAETSGWSIARYRYFLYVFIGSFVWYWFPGWIAQFLSVFAFVTWIRPNNVVINQLFGGFTGLSLIPITFDWTQVTGYVFSPLVPPFHAIANTLIGCVLWFWIVTSGIHFSGKFYAEYLPMSDSNSYDNTGAAYNVTKILNSDYTFDEAAYKEYSPLFLSSTFALCYGLSFATITSLIIHTGLFHSQEIWQRFKAAQSEDMDIHGKLMQKYKESPEWWYGVVFIIMFAISLGTVLGYPTHLSWWAFIVSLIISLVFSVPIGIIQATTNIQIGLNVITEFIVGYIQPGKPIAMMLFKTYGYITMTQALAFVQDLKLGHYMKVPPRVVFSGQIVATVWSSIVQICVLEWAFGAIPNMCHKDQPNHYTCPNGRVFFNASVIWGVIGPARIFNPGQLYGPMLWFFLAGAVLPIAIYFGARMFPKSNIRYLNAPLIFGGTGNLPPATPLNYLSWGIIGTIFNKMIRNSHRGWWSRYNYITSAALDVGLALSTIIIFFTLQLTNQKAPNWWGNNVVESTLDAQGAAIQKPPPADPGFFGPSSW